jgi:hypothetical protein
LELKILDTIVVLRSDTLEKWTVFPPQGLCVEARETQYPLEKLSGVKRLDVNRRFKNLDKTMVIK